MFKFHRHILFGWFHFWKQLLKALKNPIFIIITLVGNVALFSCAGLLYFLEKDVNPGVTIYGDAVWWAFSTMTTVGYGDIVPVTGFGRVIAVFLMFSGGVLFLSLVALLGSTFTELEFLELRREIRHLRSEVKELSERIEK